ncbi:MAG: hydantoinase B/oxoprolinase family protein [Hyphomicrobiaceae bacterium]
MSGSLARYRLGFDIGGTFTDLVLMDAFDGTLRLHKCLTTPDDPAIGALSGIGELLESVGVSLADVGHVVHGTTLVSNAIIERRGCRLGFLTTRGFRDVLQLGTEQRYDIHDLFLHFPDPLAPRRLRREVTERMDRDGNPVIALDLDQARQEIDFLVAEGVEAIAVCLLHSYKNPDHERAVRDLIHDLYPNLTVSISSDVHPELKEYGRASTTAANAYVQPLMQSYVTRLQIALRERGFEGQFHLMQSSGDLSSSQAAAEFPIRFLESGPAGGAQMTAFVGSRLGADNIVSFDMGGTTAKACLIRDNRPDIAQMLEAGRVHRFKRGSGLPIHAPVVDMIEIGAGGGSIARIDSSGVLKVGPDSAGAAPGPACYGLNGTDPTVTDANMLLGYLDPNYFLGGRMKLDVAASEAAIGRLADGLNLDVMQTAAGIVELVAENMAGAARVHIVEKGHDPRNYAIVAMGGAGPLHAAQVAAKLGAREVIIPPASGAASALGLLSAPLGREVSRSSPSPLSRLDLAEANQLLAGLEQNCRDVLEADGIPGSEMALERRADMRLSGQMHEITVVIPEGTLDARSVAEIEARFVREYARLYTHVYDGAQIEIINWRVRCNGPQPTISIRLKDTEVGERKARPARSIYSPLARTMVEAQVYDRYALRPGATIDGPAIIEEREATTVVPEGAIVGVDEDMNLCMTLDRRADSGTSVSLPENLDEAIAQLNADPVGLEILWSRMINIAEECWHTVIRTAFSLIIGEAQDFACEILDANGRQIVHSPRAMPVFNLTLPIAINAMLERFPPEALVDGDVLITNDPWLCAGHLFDIAIAVPVFRDGVIVAFTGIVGHVSDIGGTKDQFSAREIYDEGIQIPPMKLFRAGTPNEDLFELLQENVRRPDQVLGDVHALVSAGRTGAERIKEFMAEYDMANLETLASVVQERAGKVMRDAIAELPDGDYRHVVQADGIDEIMTYPIKVSVRGDRIEVDFDGAPPQTTQGGSNCTFSYTSAHATYPLKCIFTPEIPGNAGCYQPISVAAPSGSILNCDRPMAVNTRVRTGWYVAPNIFGALAKVVPDKVQAFTGLPASALFYGVDETGQIYSDHLFQGGGQGASQHSDGVSGLLYPTSASNTSVELFETRVPVLVTEKSLVSDSGGPGQKRGGLSQVVRARKLHADQRPCQAGLYPNGVRVQIGGLFGGRPGGKASASVRVGDGQSTDLDTGGLCELTGPNDLAELVMAGGSGFGDAWTRSFDEVQQDLDEEFLTSQGARRDYGCVVDGDGRIDREASTTLRAQRHEPA